MLNTHLSNDFKEQNWYRLGYDVGRGLKKFKEQQMFSFYLAKQSFYKGYLDGKNNKEQETYDNN